MKFKIGSTRRAVWKELTETFIVQTREPFKALTVGGWTDDGKKVWVQFDLDDAAKLLDRAKGLTRDVA